jgi:spore photoproduct lyase
MISELKDHITERPDQFHRFCTGEFADSLALEPLTGVAARLASLFNGFENASIEFKTKSDNVRELLGLNPKGNQVVSFSVNAASIAFGQELGAASLERRIKAARMAQESGYKIGFHFDPIIPIGDWKQEYLKTINMIYDNIDCERIAWISLGVMRFAPKLKETARSRFGQIPLFHLSYHSGIDGKKRLFVNRRIEIYRWIIDGIKGRDSNARIYFCMESSYVWKEALGVSMESDEDLIRFLGMAFP